MWKCINIIGLFLTFISQVHCDKYFIPTQHHFVAQQSAHSVFHHGHVGSAAAAASASFATSPQAFLNIGWSIPPVSSISTTASVLASASAGANAGNGGWGPGPGHFVPGGLTRPAVFLPELGVKPIDFTYPTVLKPTGVPGWDTSYNVPCGSYIIHPFVTATFRINTLYATTTNQGFRVNPGPSWGWGWHPSGGFASAAATASAASRYPRSLNPTRNARYYSSTGSDTALGGESTCTWNFVTAGACKLKFGCDSFHMPALFRCEENALDVTDTGNQTFKFCSNRRPRKTSTYSSTTGKMKVRFSSRGPSLPAAFECSVVCVLEYKYTTHLHGGNSSSQSSTTKVNATVSNKLQHSVGTKEVDFLRDNATSTASIPSSLGGNLRLADCKCGLQRHHSIRGRIVGGMETLPGEWPWHVALVRKNGLRPFCGGSLINDQYVITAAHCVLNTKIKRVHPLDKTTFLPKDMFHVFLNVHDMSREYFDYDGALRRNVDQIIVHPEYDNVTYDYDIALLRLEQPVQLTHQLSPRPSFISDEDSESESNNDPSRDADNRLRSVRTSEFGGRGKSLRPIPVCLPERSNSSLSDKNGIVTGFGLTREDGRNPSNELLQAPLEIFNMTSCEEFYRPFQYSVTNNMMCAGHVDGQADSCVGDSGGPLVVQKDKNYYLAGIVSWGKGCGRKNLPGVYTRVSGLTDWIVSHTLDATWCPE